MLHMNMLVLIAVGETMKLLLACALLSLLLFTFLHESAHYEICREAGGKPEYGFLIQAGSSFGIMGVSCDVNTPEKKLADAMIEGTYTQVAIITTIWLAAIWMEYRRGKE